MKTFPVPKAFFGLCGPRIINRYPDGDVVTMLPILTPWSTEVEAHLTSWVARFRPPPSLRSSVGCPSLRCGAGSRVQASQVANSSLRLARRRAKSVAPGSARRARCQLRIEEPRRAGSLVGRKDDRMQKRLRLWFTLPPRNPPPWLTFLLGLPISS